MIRRINKTTDLKDVIKSCPEMVIDNVYKIEYYIYGEEDNVYESSFSKVGNTLVAVIPTIGLESLGEGILYRKAYYKVLDPIFPDGEYNLVMVDCMDVWIA